MICLSFDQIGDSLNLHMSSRLESLIEKGVLVVSVCGALKHHPAPSPTSQGCLLGRGIPPLPSKGVSVLEMALELANPA